MFVYIWKCTDQAYRPLCCLLLIGIFKPHVLIFSLSLASSLDVNLNDVFSPMRVVIIFTGIALLIHVKDITANVTKSHLICLIYCAVFGLWCVLCTCVRIDQSGVVDINIIITIITIFIYAMICVMVFMIVHPKYSIPTYIWIGLVPTVVSSILATTHLRKST